MATKFNHVFHVGTNELYATPYSFSDDCMEGTVPVCSSFSGISDSRLAKLLTRCLFYAHWMNEPFVVGHEREYVIKHLVSLQYRVARYTGRYAFQSIMDTLGIENLIV